MTQHIDNPIFNFFQGRVKIFLFCLITGAVSGCTSELSAQETATRLDPPHWWSGMKNTSLELLIYGKDAGKRTYEIKGASNVKLERKEKPANTDYIILFLDLADAPPQTFTIAAEGEDGNFSYNYTLKARTPHTRGLDQSDLIYLITPDRFANGDPDNDSFENMNETGIDRSEPYARHGGDIQGMIDKIGYMKTLGVTAVWPNPLYENDQPDASYHGYAFTDHYKIDRRFGDNALFGTFCDSLRANGMKMVMDVVYNHVGDRHFLFTDMPDSTWFHLHPEFLKTNYRATTLLDPYASDYDKHKMTDGWFDTHMPDLNQKNPRVAAYLIQQTLWWTEEYGIEALRIDTYAYPDQDFMRSWGKAVKTEFPDIFIFAETWVHGHHVQGFFLGDALGPEANYIDGLTDFQVHYAINDGFTRDQGWTEGISRLYYTLAADYLYAHPENLVTFTDNHDLARFYGVVGRDFRKFSAGMALLFTLRGIPSLYYGTEILMAETDGHGKIREDFPGGWPDDPVDKFSRKGRTDEENRAFDLIRTLARLRQNNTALQTGATTQFVPEDGVYAYFRYDDKVTFFIVVNTSNDPKVRPLEMYRELIPEGSRPERVMGDAEADDEGNLKIPGTGFGVFKIIG